MVIILICKYLLNSRLGCFFHYYNICLLIVLINYSFSFSQEMVTERLLEVNEEIQDASDVLDFLQELNQNPLNINNATIEELQAVPGISPSIAYTIGIERQKRGS